MVTHEEFTQANDRAKELGSCIPKAVSARYDRHIRRVVVRLNSSLGIFFSPKDAEGLEHATPEQLNEIEISPSGYGIYFPQLDADFYLPSLLEGVFGSERWMASRSGEKKDGLKRATRTKAACGEKSGSPKRKGTLATQSVR